MKFKHINRIWNEEQIADSKIVNYLNEILFYGNEQLEFYFDRGKTRRWLANGFLITAIILFTVSLLFPILSGPNETICVFGKKINYYSISYLFLVLAGILLFIDRFFGHSDAWMRYVLTRMQLNKIVSEYHGRWIKLNQSLDFNNLTNENINDLIDLLQEFDRSLREIVIAETETWKGLLSQRISDFGKRVNTKLDETTKDLKEYKAEIKKKLEKNAEVNESKKQKGILSIRFLKKKDSNITITISGPDKNKTVKLESYRHSITYLDLKLGYYLLQIEELEGNNKKVVEKVVKIENNTIKEVEIDLK